MNLANLDFYRENEEDFSEILYEFRKKSYEESRDYFIFTWDKDSFMVLIDLVYEIIPGKYSYSSESPEEYYDQKTLVGWYVNKICHDYGSGVCFSWTYEEFLKELDEKGKMCFNSELKKFVDLHS